jgi:hypothetical protein
VTSGPGVTMGCCEAHGLVSGVQTHQVRPGYRLVGVIAEGQGAGMFEGLCADCEDG